MGGWVETVTQHHVKNKACIATTGKKRERDELPTHREKKPDTPPHHLAPSRQGSHFSQVLKKNANLSRSNVEHVKVQGCSG